ncbi:hypothetical protein QQ999_16115 [Pseudomonas fluorescens]
MTTPPKATCHSCNGTGIDPVVGFLDCEFCTPAFAGVSLSAPEQPEPKCETCNDHGYIGCLRPDGYDGERCPDCNPAVVKRYHVTEAGIVEGSALGRINVVLASDYDAAVTHIRDLELLAGQEMKSTELATNAGLRVCLERDALQALLTAADERVDVLSQGSALGDVHLERLRQIDVENRFTVDDDDYSLGQLAYAAAGYAQGSVPAQQVQGCLRPSYWPWHPRWWKPGSPRRMLVKAGALILAEIERIDRLASKP